MQSTFNSVRGLSFATIRRKVCSVCIDGLFDAKGRFISCGLGAGRICPLERYLPEVIEAVESIDSPRIADYIDVLREKVCTQCEQSENGICELRLRADCALDRYFVLVAEAIDEVRSGAEQRAEADVS